MFYYIQMTLSCNDADDVARLRTFTTENTINSVTTGVKTGTVKLQCIQKCNNADFFALNEVKIWVLA